jgi:type VI secretion system protein ImpE
VTDPREHLRNGDIDSAREALQGQIRAEPANAELRVFMFQLLCITGDWGRAMTQLSVAGDLDSGTLGMVQVYREALKCEALRARVFSGERSPLIFGEPQQWVALLLEALKLTAAGRFSEGQQLRDEAFSGAPTTPGRLNGQAFEWIADADGRLGPILEAIINGRYYWVPFGNIAELRLEEPEDLRDLVWMPAQLRWTNGGDAVALLPGRYPGSEQSGDPSIRLARRTEWVEQQDGFFIGLGQRMLATDEGEYPLMEVRDVHLEIPDLGQTQAGGDG